MCKTTCLINLNECMIAPYNCLLRPPRNQSRIINVNVCFSLQQSMGSMVMILHCRITRIFRCGLESVMHDSQRQRTKSEEYQSFFRFVLKTNLKLHKSNENYLRFTITHYLWIKIICFIYNFARPSLAFNFHAPSLP